MISSKLILASVLIVAAFLRFYRVEDLMMFIGDQGWFYLSARDLLLTGDIPLVGITSSYTWLHQGALWTYLLAPILWLFNFNPIAGAYLSISFGIISVWVIYYVGRSLFKDEQVGLTSALLFAASPLVIIHSRIAYHTAPIPLATLLFIFSLCKYATGKIYYLPLATFLLGVLYNLEFATMVFWPFSTIVVLIVRKLQPKTLFLSFISFLIPMLPMTIYDFVSRSGFFQATAFFRLIKMGIFSAGGLSFETITNILRDLFIYNQRLIFLGNGFIAAVITVGSFIFFINVLKNKYRKKKVESSYVIIGLWIALSLIGIFISKTASEAYLPMLYPGVILLIAFFFVKIIKKTSRFKTGVYIVAGMISAINVYLLLSQDYLMRDRGYGVTLKDRLEVAKKIVNISGDKEYNIIGKGTGSEFDSFTASYEYATWWFGKPQSKNQEKLKFIIEEQNGNVLLNTQRR